MKRSAYLDGYEEFARNFARVDDPLQLTVAAILEEGQQPETYTNGAVGSFLRGYVDAAHATGLKIYEPVQGTDVMYRIGFRF